MTVTRVSGDLLDQPVEAVVNAWNRNVIPWWLLLPQGVSGAIKKRGGTEPFKELAKHGPIPLGGAVATGGPGGCRSGRSFTSPASTCCGAVPNAACGIRCGTHSHSPRSAASSLSRSR